MQRISMLIAFWLVFASCAELLKVAEQLDSPRPLTNQEVVEGLKQALVIGSDSAASRLSAVNGYYHDQLIRIALPPEAGIITDNLALLPGGDKLVEDLILRINRAAEHAARDAAPIFAQAITGMSIQDGFNILRGENDAATRFLKDRTYSQLSQLYQPKIQSAIDQPLVGNISAYESWNTLTGQWNRIAGTMVGRMAELRPVDTDLSLFLTEQALNGLFLKLAMEEEKIRTDPVAQVTALLRRVFGSQTSS